MEISIKIIILKIIGKLYLSAILLQLCKTNQTLLNLITKLQNEAIKNRKKFTELN